MSSAAKLLTPANYWDWVSFRTGIAIAIMLFANTMAFAQTETSKEKHSRQFQQQINAVVTNAFLAVNDGWSSDEVILQDDLNAAFIANCEEAIKKLKPDGKQQNVTASDLNWTLMNLRKAGKLKSETTKRKRIDVSTVGHVAEIATRSITDKHQCSIDRMMSDTKIRAEFDAAATSIDVSVDCYAVRKAAFQLRKARQLRPELITRIADWGRTIKTLSVKEILDDSEVLNEHPGVYIFSDSTGYLYIGQTANLRTRLLKHLDESHNLSLAKYLKTKSKDSISIEVHDFDPKSKAAKTMVRRAYESELIASRKPRFNVQP